MRPLAPKPKGKWVAQQHKKGTLKAQIVLVASAAVLLLSAWIQTRVVNETEVIFPINADAGTYVAYAWNLREYHTFSRERTWKSANPEAPTPDKLTLPGYPLFLSLWLDGKPDQEFIAKATTVQALIGIATCLLVLMIAFRLLPASWAITVGGVTAIHPHFATINTYLLTEGLFTFLLAASIYAAVRAVQAPERLSWYLLCAVLVAATSHVRPQLQIFPFVLLLAMGLSSALRSHWRPLGLALLLFGSLMVPWQLRNASIERPHGEPILLAATLYHGSFPDFMYQDDPKTRGFPYLADPLADERTASLDTTFDWIRAEFERDPLEMTRWYLLGKPWSFMSWGIVAGLGDVFIYPIWRSPYLGTSALAYLRLASWRLHYPLMLLGLLAATAGAIRPPLVTAEPRLHSSIRMLSIVILATIAAHMVGASFPRYGIPYRWMFFLMAAFPALRATGAARRHFASVKSALLRHIVTK